MAGIPRVTPREPVTVSPSRTYIVVIHDLVTPNQARFEKITLPLTVYNSSARAKYHYLQTEGAVDLKDVITCMSWEEYMANVANLIEDVLFEKPEPKAKFRSFATDSSNSVEKDMQEVRQMLDAWNDEQEHAMTTYSMILRSILQTLQLKEKSMAQIKEVLLY